MRWCVDDVASNIHFAFTANMSERLRWSPAWRDYNYASYVLTTPDGRNVYVWRGDRDRVYPTDKRGGQWWYSNEGAPNERRYGPVRTLQAAEIAAMLLGPED